MTLIEDELRAALRAEAAKHRPDRAAMLDRITRTAVRSRHAAPSPSPRLRMTGAAVAVAAVLGGGGFAQWALAGDGEPGPLPTPTPVVSVVPTPSGPASPGVTTRPSGTPSTAPSRPARTRQSSSPVPSTGVSSAPAALWVDGSVVPDGDTQGSSVVTVKTSERLDALAVTIRLARTDGVVSRGGSQQVPGASVTSSVTEETDAIVYRFVLSSGDRLEPGTYTFYARYTHPEGGRDAGGDSYRVTATDAAVSGDFR